MAELNGAELNQAELNQLELNQLELNQLELNQLDLITACDCQLSIVDCQLPIERQTRRPCDFHSPIGNR